MPDLLPDNLVHVTPLREGGHAQSAAAIVRWSMPDEWIGRLVQVYINGRFAAASETSEQGELLVAAAGQADWPGFGVQLVAVACVEADEDFSHLLGPQPGGRRVRLSWPRANNVPLAGTVNVFGNGGAGQINFAIPLNDRPIPWWPDDVGQWGFGLAGFGQADFGGDCVPGAGCPGFGAGGFGIGQFGFDAAWASWLCETLGPGEHRFSVVVADALGDASEPSPEARADVRAMPPRIENLAAAGSDEQVVLSWN